MLVLFILRNNVLGKNPMNSVGGTSWKKLRAVRHKDIEFKRRKTHFLSRWEGNERNSSTGHGETGA
jgi:hypothetical protein